MAKKHRRPKTGLAHLKPCAPVWDGQAMARVPTDRFSRKRNVVKAQKKHMDDPLEHLPPGVPTLGQRFHSLPTELRAQVFSHLIVQPVKWNLSHKPDCVLRRSDDKIAPEFCELWRNRVDCNREWWSDPNSPDYNPYVTPWTSPWRSQWAPEQRNPYVCSICWDNFLRPRPCPGVPVLPCLCARRENLQVFLVCRRWYFEAAQVFYTQNTFAFEDNTTFINFISNLNPRWKKAISKISLMMPLASLERFEQSCRDERKIYSLIRSLPSLSYLELEAISLTDTHSVHSLIKMGLQNLRHCRFVERTKPGFGPGSEYVYPCRANRTLVQGGFAEEVARAIKCQRQKRLKNHAVLRGMVDEFAEVKLRELTRTRKAGE